MISEIIPRIIFIPQKSVVENITAQDYKLIENDYYVTIPDGAVITQIYQEGSGGAQDNATTAILLVPDDKVDAFTNSIKIQHESETRYDKNIYKSISSSDKPISFSYYNSINGKIKIQMNKWDDISKELSDRINGSKKYT
ncbi:MAG: hypothetical protein Q8900_11565, partial [Bacillota bacterium]|nr:hypothetical protein [Bacillota bacterium]